ncbi:hypothetical protein, partial [Escherichia coli]
SWSHYPIPHQLIMDKIYDVLRAYRYGCAE